MSLTPDEILDIVDPTRAHENDSSFAHWYVVDGELVNIYNSHPMEPFSPNGSGTLWYVKETTNPSTGTVTKDLTNDLLPDVDMSSIDKPGYWYIKEIVDPATGVVTKELTNLGLPTILLEVPGIWYVDPVKNELTQKGFIDFAEYGSYYTNIVLEKPIIFPSVMKVGKWAFAETSMLEVYLNPECERYSTSFPEECEVKDWPLSIRVTSMPTKTTYNVGEDLDIDGLVALGTLDMSIVSRDYGSYAYNMNNDYITVSSFDNTTPGQKVVMMRYKTPYSSREYSFALPEMITVV